MQEPVVEELKKKFDGSVTFKKIDIYKDGELAEKYNIMAVLILTIEKDGKIFEKYVGLTRTKILENRINEALWYRSSSSVCSKLFCR